jgi:hypothetical protein
LEHVERTIKEQYRFVGHNFYSEQTNTIHAQKQKIFKNERKAGISGTSANLAVKLFGAGMLSAVACDKSLR